MSRDLDAVLASIDGALADEEFPDAMRWSPEPETVDAPHPFDGETVYVGREEYGSRDPRAYGLVEVTPPREERVVLPSPLPEVMERLREQVRAERARGRVMARARGARGMVPDLVLFDETFLVDPAHRAEVLSDREDAARRIVEHLGEWWAGVAEAVSSTCEQLGKAFAAIAPQPEPPRTLRETDPRAYALQLRQSRGTGPDRQVQRQHRPRRHS